VTQGACAYESVSIQRHVASAEVHVPPPVQEDQVRFLNQDGGKYIFLANTVLKSEYHGMTQLNTFTGLAKLNFHYHLVVTLLF
jgi:hypothetical protein